MRGAFNAMRLQGMFLRILGSLALAALVLSTHAYGLESQARRAGVGPAEAGPADAGRAPNGPAGIDPLPGLETFVDGIAAAQLRSALIPGLVVVVVHRGELVLAKGYGYADLEHQRRVDPQRTLFRIASISKLFVATSVMQLVDAGRLDVDADVANYLERPFTRRFPQPIRARDLLTHSAGFEDGFTGVLLPPGSAVPSLQTVMDLSLPAQAFPPGTYPAYSNHGFVVLGRIIERISGESYADYVEAHVLKPLGMLHSSAHQPPPPPLADEVAVGYGAEGGRVMPHPFEVVAASPGGGLSTTGADMARFMLFELGDSPAPEVLSSATRERMQSRQFGVDPRANGMGFAFPLQTLNGRRGWFHTGGLEFAFSRLTALPDEHFAIFVAYNTSEGGGAMSDLVDAVLDRYFPAPPEDFPSPSLSPPPSDGGLRRYAGAYQTSGSYYVSAPALAAAAGQLIVEPAGPGLLRVSRKSEATLFRWVGGDRFRQITGHDGGKTGDIVFTSPPGTDRPQSFERANHATRVNIRRDGWSDIRVARRQLRASFAGGLIIVLTLCIGAGYSLRRRRFALAAGEILLAGSLGLLVAFFLLYRAGTSDFLAGEIHSLTLPGRLQALLALPRLSIATAAIGAFVALATLLRSQTATAWHWTALLAAVAFWGFAAAFLSFWHFLP